MDDGEGCDWVLIFIFPLLNDFVILFNVEQPYNVLEDYPRINLSFIVFGDKKKRKRDAAQMTDDITHLLT